MRLSIGINRGAVILLQSTRFLLFLFSLFPLFLYISVSVSSIYFCEISGSLFYVRWLLLENILCRYIYNVNIYMYIFMHIQGEHMPESESYLASILENADFGWKCSPCIIYIRFVSRIFPIIFVHARNHTYRRSSTIATQIVEIHKLASHSLSHGIMCQGFSVRMLLCTTPWH